MRKLLLLFGCAGALLGIASPAWAVEEKLDITHIFDAKLSLTGDCSVSASIDPVPDPSCPGGPLPVGPFQRPTGIAIDAYGNRYIATRGKEEQLDPGDRVAVFDPQGFFITELGGIGEPTAIAVDSKGNLYVTEKRDKTGGSPAINRYEPSLYEPATGEIEYGKPPVLVASKGEVGSPVGGLVINPLDDRLFQAVGPQVRERGSAAEGNELLDTFAIGSSGAGGSSLALDAAHGKIYATDCTGSAGNLSCRVRVVGLSPPHELLGTIDGSTTPAGRFAAECDCYISVAVEEQTGNVFVADLTPAKKVYEFEPDGTYVSTYTRSFLPLNWPEMEVDNGPHSPARGTLFVPSNESIPGRSLAFVPKPSLKPPVVEEASLGGITEEEAVLRARVNPNSFETEYRFEYTTEQNYQDHGFAGAEQAGGGTISPSGEGVAVTAALSGLEPGGAYRFRVAAENEGGSDAAELPFVTFRPAPALVGECPNQTLRTGASGGLPDCRAYELVTPPNTNGRTPTSLGGFGVQPVGYAVRQSSPGGERVSFRIEGGALPGQGATGGIHGDPYLATRGPNGWSTVGSGPDGSEVEKAEPKGVSPDQGHQFWQFVGNNYLHYPDGHSEPVGQGSLGTDLQVQERLATENLGHLIFATKAGSAVRLEPAAPAAGTATIYDRTADGTTHVVSLLPGETIPGAGQNAGFLGASADGEGVAFSIGSTIYLRQHDTASYAVTTTPAAYAGLAAGGGRIFYVKGGNLLAFDAASDATVPFSSSGDVTVVNVAADGSSAYFTSPSVLAGAGPDGTPQAGKENLYLSEEGQISFVATVTERDVEGDSTGNVPVEGLGMWTDVVGKGQLGSDPSRTTADGGVLLFESRAQLTAYDSRGQAEIYRYSARAGTLQCISCSPTLAPPRGKASLQPISQTGQDGVLLRDYSLPVNMRADGRRAFFQSPDPLVLADTDNLEDVYEWEEEGVGSCREAGGCVYLISSGRSTRDNYLYAVSDSGDDVFFETADVLLAADPNDTPSIYDARVGGGFPPPPARAGECLGEACQPAAVAQDFPTPASLTFEGAGNAPSEARSRCPKGKRKLRRRGRTRCVAVAHKRGEHGKRSNTKGGAAR